MADKPSNRKEPKILQLPPRRVVRRNPTLATPEEDGSAPIVETTRIKAREPGQSNKPHPADSPYDPIPVERALLFMEWRKPFLKALRVNGNITASCRPLHVTKATVEKYMAAIPDFAAEVEAAIDEAGDMLEALALQRARNGSDYMLAMLLRGAKPEKFGNRSTVTHKFSDEDRKKVYDDARSAGLTDEDARAAVAEVEAVIRSGQTGKGSR